MRRVWTVAVSGLGIAAGAAMWTWAVVASWRVAGITGLGIAMLGTVCVAACVGWAREAWHYRRAVRHLEARVAMLLADTQRLRVAAEQLRAPHVSPVRRFLRPLDVGKQLPEVRRD